MIAVLLAFCYPALSQQQYKNLVLEGGGVRGFAYVGAITALDSLGILEKIERVGGTSAGAIQATMIAVGYTPEEIAQEVADIPLKDFNDGNIVGGIRRLKRKFGFYKGEKVTAWVSALIAKKTGDADITFMQLHLQKNEKHYKDLYITGTDLSDRCLKVFSYETFPNMRIKDALRISFSIPLYFEPVFINDSGYVEKDRNKPGVHMMVDGGLLSNYPIHIFDSSRYFTCSNGSNACINTETLGLLLEKPGQLDYRRGNRNSLLHISTLNEYIGAVYKTVIDRPNPDEAGYNRTIIISDLGLNGRVRKLPKETIDMLIESGKHGVKIFFEKVNNTTIKKTL